MLKDLGYPIGSSDNSGVSANQPNREGAEKTYGGSDLLILLKETVEPITWGRGRRDIAASTGNIDPEERRIKSVRTSLEGISNRARTVPKHRFGNLYGCLNEDYLIDSVRYLKTGKASGIDKVSLDEYKEDLVDHIQDLLKRLKEKRYRPPHVKRVYIPKKPNKKRPLGLPTVEDKLVQAASSRILSSIYEEDFKDFSYGYRPGRSIHQAIRELNYQLRFKGYQWIVEADIKGFFENLGHDWMLKMLEQRVNDKAFIGLIRKWLRCGIIEPDGSLYLPKKGTPQGGVISAVLANIYLHYVLDLWFDKVIKRHSKGKASMIRYADDFIVAFTNKADAEEFMKVLPIRLEKFGLELSVEKTKLIEFGMKTWRNGNKFDFLGFEFRWTKSRKGKLWIKMQTSLKKFNNSLDNFKDWIKENRHEKLVVIRDKLIVKCRSYRQHYQVIGNARRVQAFFWKLHGFLFKWLNRRSQKKSYSWQGYNDLLRGLFAPLMNVMNLKPSKAKV
jgi:RNA-directed DNA polymerase